MSTGAEKVLPLGSTDRLAGEIEALEYSLWFCLTAFYLFRIEAEVGGGVRE